MLTWGITVFHFNCAERVPPAGVADQAPRPAVTNGATTDTLLSEHMAAEAMLTAHFIAAAVKAGMSTEEINGVLTSVADGSAISEFWVSDETGAVVYTNIPGVEFAFPTDPEADSQAAPFAVLLTGDQGIVDQEFMPRALDGMAFKYVAAAGVDQSRIVQVGVAAPMESEAP
jgi:hypothetical protein